MPVLCGSSYRNIGVQPLLDGITQYLPSPADRTYEFVQAYAANHDLCALAFKVQNDVQRGPITFVRIYSGQIDSVETLTRNVICTVLNLLSSFRDKKSTMSRDKRLRKQGGCIWPVRTNLAKCPACRKATLLSSQALR